MTKDQMQGLYRDAADKQEQLEILGDLNLCTPVEIAEILGVEYKPKTWRVEMTDEQIETLKDLANQGYSIRAMCRVTGMSDKTLKNRMAKFNIRIDRQKWKERKYSKRQSKTLTHS